MLYKKHRKVPVSTTATSPDKQTLKVTKGTLKYWIVNCPEECADWMRFKVKYHGSQILPFGGGEWMDALKDTGPMEDNIAIDTPPYELEIYAYNTSTANEHEYNVYAGIVREEPVKIPATTQGAITRLRSMFGGG